MTLVSSATCSSPNAYCVVAEIGLAYGSSALAIGEAHLTVGRTGPNHVIIDAYQNRFHDVGGGTGRYATSIAARGYTVHLVDPVLLHLLQARARSERVPEHCFALAQSSD
jgi:hypothetical protein